MPDRGARRNAGRGALRGRSATGWALRAGLAAAALAAGYLGAAQSFAHSFRADAARAYALSPWNGRVAALLSRQLSDEDATPADRARADGIAKQALRQDPTAVAAVATLGLNAQLHGHAPAARRLFAYAQKLSRRDLPTQLWAIEAAVGRGDVAGALSHYDIALRVSRNAPALLYPILASALADVAVRRAVVSTLAARPGWGESFVNYVAGNGADARATAALFGELRRAGVPVAPEASAVVTNALILGGHWDAAWSYYAAIHPGAERDQSRDPRFQSALAVPSPFDWTPANDAGITTSIQPGERNGAFVFAAPSSVGGSMLQQVQMLPPGTYRLIGRSSGVDQPEGSRPYWVLNCRTGRELGRLAMPNSTQSGGRFAGLFQVPEGCPVQILALVARPSDAVSGIAGQLDVVQLAPVKAKNR